VRTLADADVRAADVLAEDYVLRSPASEEHETLTGLSVARMLVKVGYAPREGFLRMDRADGTWTTLSADDVAEPSPFQDGRKPLVFLDDVRTRFLRPVRDGSDENADDNLATQPGDPLEIWVQTGAPLTVTATASKDTAAKGEAVTFTASVSGQHAGETLSVDWRFDDGETAPGTRVDHRFTQDGVYGVVAQVHGDDDDSGGASQVLRIRVGSPSTTDGPGTGGGTSTGPASAAGPSRGPVTGTGTTRPNRHAGNQGTGETGDRSGTKIPKPGATATPAPAAAPTSPAPAVTSPPTPTTPGSPSPSRALPETKPRATPTTPEDGELVRGVLVSASAPLSVPPAAAQVRAGARAAAQAGVAATPLSLTGFAVLLLLAGGAWREATGRRRRGKPA
jgi:hypothetical protein